MNRFSERHEFQPENVDIEIQYEAPIELREYLVKLSYDCKMNPKRLREVLCTLLRRRENPNNWSDFPNIDNEVHEIISSCGWYEVYDIIEAIYSKIEKSRFNQYTEYFKSEINKYFYRKGIGWKLIDGKVEVRSSKGFEQTINKCKETLEDASYNTSANEIYQAILDLSRRPKPDITGSIQHAMASLECVVKEINGNRKDTLGKILSNNSNLIQTPLREAIIKLWGFTSEFGRHLREGRDPTFEEAELIVAISAAMAMFLTKKYK